eukprot:25578_1
MKNPNTRYKMTLGHQKRTKQNHFPVLQLDTNNCKVLKIWNCPSELTAQGYSVSRILTICHGRKYCSAKTAYGHIWTFNGNQKYAQPIKSTNVIQFNKFDPVGIIKQWTQKELRDAGYNVCNIISCCNGRCKTTQGYQWKYVDPQ